MSADDTTSPSSPGAETERNDRTDAEVAGVLADGERMARLGSWSWDVQNNRSLWSPGLYRLLGFAPGAPPSMESFVSTVHPDDRATLISLTERAIARGESLRALTVRVVRPNGEVRRIRFEGESTFDGPGRLVRMVGTAMDVTEREEAEEQLRRTAMQLNEAQRIAGVGSFVFDVLANRIEWSEQLFRIFGHEPFAFQPTREVFHRHVHPDDEPQFDLSRQITAATGSPPPTEFRVVQPSGEVRQVLMTCQLGRDEAGRIARVTGTILDVTERKRLEEQLRQSQKLEALGTLAGGVAHDFNNYLLVVLAAVDDLRTRAGAAKADDGPLGQIATAAEHCVRLTRQLLTFGRKHAFSPEPSDVNAIVTRSLRLVRGVLGDKVRAVVELAPELPPVLLDPQQFDQVIVNLAVNARDAMPNGGRVTVSTRLLEGPAAPAQIGSRAIALEFKDEGVGIPPELQARVFEPFFTTKASGVGLGLSTAYGIVKQSGGEIVVRSQPGAGTAFTIHLPVATCPSRPREATPPPAARPTETILLVEDEDMVRNLAKAQLERSGYHVVDAPDGQRALEVASELGRIDLLVSDVRMPRLGGLELAERLVQVRPGLRVLLMSGYADPTLLERASLPAGAEFIHKPFTIREILEKIRALLAA